VPGSAGNSHRKKCFCYILGKPFPVWLHRHCMPASLSERVLNSHDSAVNRPDSPEHRKDKPGHRLRLRQSNTGRDVYIRASALLFFCQTCPSEPAWTLNSISSSTSRCHCSKDPCITRPMKFCLSSRSPGRRRSA
jgi:hypothetical protein